MTSDCGCKIEITDEEQKGVLISLLVINAFMFVFEISLGWYAQSTGLSVRFWPLTDVQKTLKMRMADSKRTLKNR